MAVPPAALPGKPLVPPATLPTVANPVAELVETKGASSSPIPEAPVQTDQIFRQLWRLSVLKTATWIQVSIFD